MKPGIYQGDSLELLRLVPAQSVDALITDSPYSSGSLHISGRQKSTGQKYQQNGCQHRMVDFEGDNRDQRSWTAWQVLWLSLALEACKPGAYCMLFTDWRQLPSTTDALQMAGFTWRGIIPWDKTEGSRAPHRGYFRHQCEYVVWGSRGSLPSAEHGGPWPGCYRMANKRSERHHMTSKPLELMRRLAEVVRPGGLVLDPFCGGGSTPVACAEMGRNCIGFEKTSHYATISRERYEEALRKATA